jgi:two-component system, response regulator, stage 0 sporulation protein A
MNKTSVVLNILVDEIRELRNEVAELKELINGQGNKSSSEGNLLAADNSEINNDTVISSNVLDRQISKMLIEHKVAVHHKGYRYLREAIKLEYTDNVLNAGITKFVYPEIARRFNDTPNRVERSMRHAVEAAWYKPNQSDMMQKVLSKPTNSEFIAMLADKLRLENNVLSA